MPDKTSRNDARRKNYEQTRANADRARLPWERWELRAIHTRALVTEPGSKNLTDRELSAILGRSVQAIQIHRSRTEAPS